MRVLVLSGTPEARQLASALYARKHVHVVSSYAGLAQRRLDPPGELRVGGFGGQPGLRGYLIARGIDAVVNATHPFAERMTRTAHRVCHELDIPYLRLLRPAWTPEAGDNWREFQSLPAAISSLDHSAHVLLALGRAWSGITLPPGVRATVRVLDQTTEEHATPAVPGLSFVRVEASMSADQELAMMERVRPTHLLCKNSGGIAGRAKLDAARRLSLPVLMLGRPPSGTDATIDIQAVTRWIDTLART